MCQNTPRQQQQQQQQRKRKRLQQHTNKNINKKIKIKKQARVNGPRLSSCKLIGAECYRFVPPSNLRILTHLSFSFICRYELMQHIPTLPTIHISSHLLAPTFTTTTTTTTTTRKAALCVRACAQKHVSHRIVEAICFKL